MPFWGTVELWMTILKFLWSTVYTGSYTTICVYNVVYAWDKHTVQHVLCCSMVHTHLKLLRGNKTHKNRQYRQAVTGNPAKGLSRMFSDINRLHCEEVLVDVQLSTGCVLWMCEDGEQLADYVITMTKSISESHYRWIERPLLPCAITHPPKLALEIIIVRSHQRFRVCML